MGETKPLDFNDLRTWPRSLTDRLQRGARPYFDYVEEQRELGISISPRRFLEDIEISSSTEIIEHLEEIRSELGILHIIGYHATRLMKYEQNDVKLNGLKQPSPEFRKQRIIRAAEFDYISKSNLKNFLTQNDFDYKGRTGLWFSLDNFTLRDEYAVGRFFRSWSGEALYVSHEQRCSGEILRKMGEPCIVTAPVRISDLGIFNIDKIFLIKFLSKRNIVKYKNWEIAGATHSGAQGVIEVIPMSDPRFEKLTRCSLWKTPLR